MTVETVYRWLRSGSLPHLLREGGRRRFYLIRRRDVLAKLGLVPARGQPASLPVSRAVVDALAEFGCRVGG